MVEVKPIGADDVAEAGVAGLRCLEERGVVGKVALHVPGVSLVLQRFSGGAEVDVHIAEKDLSGTVKLDAGLDGEVSRENDLRPGAGAVGGRSEVEVLIVEVGEGLVGEQRDFAVLGVGPGHEGVGRGFKRGSGV